MADRRAGRVPARPAGEPGHQLPEPGEVDGGGLKLRMRLLGRTGLLVSEFALGTMTFGQEADEPAAMAPLDRYIEAGGTLVDTADVYPPPGPKGTSEEMIGRWLKRHPEKRDSIVLATKCRGRMDPSGNAEGLSRHWIVRACEGSLRRLQTDHIDLYQAHSWDPATPIGATRLGEDPNRGVEAYDRRNTERTWRIVEAVQAIATQLGVPPARVALRWLADRPGVAAPILGARRVEQLRDNLGATEVTLDEEQRAHLDDVSAQVTPDYPYRVLADGTAERRRLL